MKPILDNGIDHLFKSSLEDYEIKPSAESWKRINEQLGSKSQDNKQPYWWAAASVILVLGIGLVFFRSDREVIQLKGKTEIAVISYPGKNKEQYNILCDFTEDIALLEESLDKILIGGNTPTGPAIKSAVQLLCRHLDYGLNAEEEIVFKSISV